MLSIVKGAIISLLICGRDRDMYEKLICMRCTLERDGLYDLAEVEYEYKWELKAFI